MEKTSGEKQKDGRTDTRTGRQTERQNFIKRDLSEMQEFLRLTRISINNLNGEAPLETNTSSGQIPSLPLLLVTILNTLN